MRTRKRFSFVPLVLLVVLGAGAYLLYRKVVPSRVSNSVPFAQLAPREKAQRRVEAQKLTAQVEKVAREAKSGEKKSFKIEASEEQLNTLLQERLDTAHFPVKDLNVGLSPSGIALQGRANYKGLDATATLFGNITVENGQLVFKAGDLKVQGFSVGSMQKKAEKEVTRALNQWSEKLPGKIESVVIEDQKITIEGSTKR